MGYIAEYTCLYKQENSITTTFFELKKKRIFTRGIERRIYVHVYDNYRLIDLPWNSPFTW